MKVQLRPIWMAFIILIILSSLMNDILAGSMKNQQYESASDQGYGSQFAKISADIEYSRTNRIKKPSAFKSSSSQSSKRKQVIFNDDIRQSGHGSIRSSHRKKGTNSPGGNHNESDLFIQDVDSEKCNENSRILIHVSTQGKIEVSKISAEVAYLKQLQKTVKGELLQLSKAVGKMYSKLSQELGNQLLAYKQRVEKQCESEQTILKDSMISIERNLRDENKNLSKELQELRLQKKSLKRRQDCSPGRSSNSCANCKLLQIKINSIRENAIQSAQTISKLQSQNQALQQVIFDLQQQVVGIDLLVEKKLKAALSEYQPQPQEAQDELSKNIISNMAKDIERLNTQCRHYEELCKKEEELQRKEIQVQKIRRDYERKNDSLLEAIARNEQTIDRNYQRQHKLLMAEEDFFKKFQQIRQKESQLSRWEATLTEKSIKSNHRISTAQPVSSDGRQGEQISLSNLGAKETQQKEYHFSDYRVTMPARPNQTILQQNKSQAERGSLYHEYEPRTYQKPRYRDNIKESRHNNIKNYQGSLYTSKVSHDYQGRKLNPSHSNKNVQHRSDLVERASAVNKYEMRRGTPYMDKSSSPARSFKGSSASHLVRSNIQRNDNINGLQNKLDRLREELKRELESIK